MRYTHVESSGNAAHFADLEVDGRIILQFMSEKVFGKMGYWLKSHWIRDKWS